MTPIVSNASSAAYKMDDIKFIANTLDKRDLRELFAGLTKEEILAVIEEAVRLKKNSILFIICHIPESKFNVLKGINDLTFAIDSCKNDVDVERVLQIMTTEQAKILIKIPVGHLNTEEILEIPLLKACKPMALLSDKSYKALIRLHPLLLAIALRARVEIICISKYLSPKQLRFLAQFAEYRFIDELIGFLIANDYSLKLYALLLGLQLDPSNDNSYSFKKYAIKFNRELTDTNSALKKEVERVDSIKRELIQRKKRDTSQIIISSINYLPTFRLDPPLSDFLTESERVKIEKLSNTIIFISSETFQACIAAFKNSPELLNDDIVSIDNFHYKAITLLFDPPIIE